MKPLLTIVAFLLGIALRAAEAPVVNTGKSVVEYTLTLHDHDWAQGWTLYHFRALNGALDSLMNDERSGMNTKCLIVPKGAGYAVVWIRSDWEEPISEVLRKKASEVIQSYLFGKDRLRISDLLKEPNKALEPTPTSVTSPAAQEPRQP